MTGSVFLSRQLKVYFLSVNNSHNFQGLPLLLGFCQIIRSAPTGHLPPLPCHYSHIFPFSTSFPHPPERWEIPWQYQHIFLLVLPRQGWLIIPMPVKYAKKLWRKWTNVRNCETSSFLRLNYLVATISSALFCDFTFWRKVARFMRKWSREIFNLSFLPEHLPTKYTSTPIIGHDNDEE